MANTKTNKKKQPKYQQIINMDDDKINVLILGTSGCGKSTLINAIFGEEVAKTGNGHAVTQSISVYQKDELPFRMIDSVGYEYGFFKQNHIKNDLAKFCKQGIKKSEVDKLIHMIWFCIDGTVKRIDHVVLEYIKSVTNDWKNVPIIVVFTKSYSDVEIKDNVEMAKEAISEYNIKHKKKLDVRDIIPVVAKTYQINSEISIPPKGLDVLINRTNELAPEAKKLANEAIKDLDLKLKRNMANSVIAGGTAAATTVGAVPIPIPDATVLVPLQTGMMTTIAKIYGVSDKSITNEVINQILKVGGTTIAGKALLNAIKAIPGLNVAATVVNAMVAGSITLAAGEISEFMFERIYTGDLQNDGIDWETEISKLFKQYLPKALEILKDLSEKTDGKVTLADFLTALFPSVSKQS